MPTPCQCHWFFCSCRASGGCRCAQAPANVEGSDEQRSQEAGGNWEPCAGPPRARRRGVPPPAATGATPTATYKRHSHRGNETTELWSVDGGQLRSGSHAIAARSAAGTAAAEALGAPSHPWQPVHACVTSCLWSHSHRGIHASIMHTAAKVLTMPCSMRVSMASMSPPVPQPPARRMAHCPT